MSNRFKYGLISHKHDENNKCEICTQAKNG